MNLCLRLESKGPETRSVSSQSCPALINQEYSQAHQSEDSEYEEPQGGCTARQSREFPQDSTLRTKQSRAEEDHNQFTYSFRQQCQWYADKEQVRPLRERGNPVILGPRDMSPFVSQKTDAHGCSLIEFILGKASRVRCFYKVAS